MQERDATTHAKQAITAVCTMQEGDATTHAKQIITAVLHGDATADIPNRELLQFTSRKTDSGDAIAA